MTQQPPNRKEVAAALIARAESNPSFRQALISNTEAVIKQEFGETLGPGLQVKVLEETDGLLYVVLPPVGSGELSEADLAGVTGGAENPLIVGVVRSFIQRVFTGSPPTTPDVSTPVNKDDGFKKAEPKPPH